jgi:hypothetical protein
MLPPLSDSRLQTKDEVGILHATAKTQKTLLSAAENPE